MKHHGHTFILRVHGVLLLLHTKLFTHCLTHDPINMKERPIQLGSHLYPCIQTPQITNVRKTNTTTTRLHESLLSGNRCLSLGHGRCTLAGGRTKPENQQTNAMSSCLLLLLKHVHANRMKL